MFVNALEIDFDKYDVIIVGSGPAGVSVAKQLEARGKTSIILETGLNEYDPDVHDQYSAVSADGHFAENYWKNHWARAFGGTSVFWGGWCAPLTQRNLAKWPISAEDLAPYYALAANLLDRSKDFLTYDAPSISGFVLRPFSLGDPLRIADDYLADFTKNEKIHVALKANVTELFANTERNRITGLRVFNPDSGHQEIILREQQKLVLAAGGMGNAQILLSSRSKGDIAIGNETDQVGRYLMEHPHFYNCARIVVSSDISFDNLPNTFGPNELAIIPDSNLYDKSGQLDASLGLSSSDLNLDDNIEQYIVQQLGGRARAYNITVRSEMPAEATNRVELTLGRDPSGTSLLRAYCTVSSAALYVVHGYLRAMGAALAQEGKGRLRIDNDKVFRDFTGGGHTMGTTRMGDNPASSVVDENCRVHGYENLFLAGSSVFTTGGYANPTLTIVALAVRLGDHLGDRL
jgi:choline dehydrogenase-like flavoprotein